MSSNGFVNWIQKNPGTAFAIFLIFAAIVTIIVMVTMRPTASAGPGVAADIPVLNVSGTKVVKSTKISGYAMKYEYAIGEYLGDNIDFTITVDVKSGFEQKKINRLKVFRYKLNAADEKDGEYLQSEVIDGIKNFKEYSVTFVGSELDRDAVSAEGGKQYFEVIGYVVDENETETEYTDPSPLAKTPTGDLVAPKISNDDLNYVLTKEMNVPFEWTVTDAAILEVGRSDPTRTKYFLSIEPSKQVALIPDPIVPNTYMFKYDDNTFFTVDGISKFMIDQPDRDEKTYFLYTTNDQGVKVMVTRVGGTGALVLMDPREMTGDEYDAARIGITEEIITPTETSKYTGPIKIVHNRGDTVLISVVSGYDENVVFVPPFYSSHMSHPWINTYTFDVVDMPYKIKISGGSRIMKDVSVSSPLTIVEGAGAGAWQSGYSVIEGIPDGTWVEGDPIPTYTFRAVKD